MTGPSKSAEYLMRRGHAYRSPTNLAETLAYDKGIQTVSTRSRFAAMANGTNAVIFLY